jgi:uncharacterized protein
MQILEFLQQPWPWYVTGPLIGLMVPFLLLIGNKSFGISSSMRHICAACFPADISFFIYNWRKEIWNLFFAAGILTGGFLAATFLLSGEPLAISEATIAELKQLGIKDFKGLQPADIFSFKGLFSVRGMIFFILGGFLVGFGTRYAGGCTSGHAIMGLSNLQWPSLVASCCFMAGGFLMTHLILPYLILI